MKIIVTSTLPGTYSSVLARCIAFWSKDTRKPRHQRRRASSTVLAGSATAPGAKATSPRSSILEPLGDPGARPDRRAARRAPRRAPGRLRSPGDSRPRARGRQAASRRRQPMARGPTRWTAGSRRPRPAPATPARRPRHLEVCGHVPTLAATSRPCTWTAPRPIGGDDEADDQGDDGGPPRGDPSNAWVLRPAGNRTVSPRASDRGRFD
jgi:hypothetical protein